MTFTIVNTLDLSKAPEAIASLEAVGNLISLPPQRGKVLEAMAQADAYLASASIVVDEEFLDAAPRLKLIGSPSTGTDHMNLTAIDKRSIVRFDISRERDLINSFTATAELAFGLMLSVNRKLKPAFAAAERGDWARERFTGFQFHGKTLGILGLGRLGCISARIGQGFGMKVIANDLRKVEAPGVSMVDFDTLLRQSDVLTIHVHLTPATEGLFDERVFLRMKPNSIVINTSRGRIVDEIALLKALETGLIAGAGLDVIDGEWLTDEERALHPLIAFARAHPNLVITPHIAGATIESIYGARVFMAHKMAEWLRTQQASTEAARG